MLVVMVTEALPVTQVLALTPEVAALRVTQVQTVPQVTRVITDQALTPVAQVPPEIQVQQEHLVIQVITDQALTPVAVGLPEMPVLTVLLAILVQQVLEPLQVALLQPHGQVKTVPQIGRAHV